VIHAHRSHSDALVRYLSDGIGTGVMKEPSRTDAELLDAAGRDPQAFGELYDRHAAGVYRWARGSGLAEPDALDLVSELFARAWVSRKRYRDPGDGSAGPWLFGIARNLLGTHRRKGRIEAKARKRLRVPPMVEADTIDAIHERVDATARRPALEQALEALPEIQRDAVKLRIVDGLGYPEIALRLKCTEMAARKRVSLGLRFLRARLETVP
jgi:RNA polymerase sigma factor (sigma-70 family)